MDLIDDIIQFLINDPITLVLAVATAIALAIGVLGMQFISARKDVKRRAERVNTAPVAASNAATDGTPQAPQLTERQALLQRITTSIDSLFGEGDAAASKVLRQRLIQAGYYAPNAPSVFLAIRVGGMVVLGIIGFLIATVADNHMTDVYMKMVGGAGFGYFAPTILLDTIVNKRKEEHRLGFPDFLDLMIVCCEAGLSMEAAINRVCREMADAYPSLSANLYFATLEIRAGRTVNDSLSNLAGRLGIEEAKTFATLLQQSAELGSSLIDSLKIYSDEMRNKRMMRAEEKANALPSKMTVPMMVFIFPILFIILLFPAYMRVKTMWI
ncbi:MAG: type II secretion system F family protein [Beijerinckiaceae bacterium]